VGVWFSKRIMIKKKIKSNPGFKNVRATSHQSASYCTKSLCGRYYQYKGYMAVIWRLNSLRFCHVNFKIWYETVLSCTVWPCFVFGVCALCLHNSLLDNALINAKPHLGTGGDLYNWYYKNSPLRHFFIQNPIIAKYKLPMCKTTKCPKFWQHTQIPT